MWDFFETVRHRHSVRHYRSDVPVEKEKLHAILEMACAAPSAGDLQSYRVCVALAETDRKALSQAAGGQDFLAEAPACLVFCADAERAATKYGERGRHLFALQDATIAATYAQLATVAAGLASAWVGSFDEREVQRILDIEANLLPVALVAVGYAAELPEPTARRPLDEVVKYL
jgi:nitroreductase